jgi:hypothetical protein
MPIIKKNKELDGANSIFSASRKLAKRQVKNMKSPVEEEGTTPSVAPVSVDREGLVPQLLQNLNDVNGLLSSLRLVGGKSGNRRQDVVEEDDDDDLETPRPKRQRGAGRCRLKGGAGEEGKSKKGKKPATVAQLKEGIIDQKNRIKDAEAKLKMLEQDKPTTESERLYKQAQIEKYRQEIVRAKGNIKNYTKRIKERQEQEDDRRPPPPNPNDRFNELEERIQNVVDRLNNGERVARPDEMLVEINDLSRLLGLPHHYDIANADGAWELIDMGGDDEEDGREEKEEPAPAPRDPIPPPEAIEVVDDGDDGDDDELDISQFDFSKVSKSTLLVILNQLKGLVKKGDLLLKRIKKSGIVASDGDLEQITQEIAEMMSNKRFLLSHINQISRKGKEIAEYLYSILSSMVGKYIEGLKTYVKQYAQMNQEQVSSIQEDNEGEIEGAGRRLSPESVGKKGYNPKVVLSDAVRRISQFDRKYLL